MDIDARIERRRRRDGRPGLVRGCRALSPVTHVDEPVDRGAALERVLDHLDPVFDGRLPPNAYVHGPFGAGKSAVVTALFAHLRRFSTGTRSVIHTSTRAPSRTAPEFVSVDMRGKASDFAFYHSVLDALVEDRVPEHGIGTGDLRARLHDLLGESRAGVVVAVDHVGFGLSDRATHEAVPMDHAGNLDAFVTALDLRDVTLVVHDWGGPIGVGALLESPDRVTGLVVCNATVFPMPFVGPTFDDYPIGWLPWADFPRVTPDALWPAVASYAVFRRPAGEYRVLADLLLYLARVEGLGWFPDRERAARRVYYQQFDDPWNTRASKRLVRQTRYWGHGNSFEDPELGTRNTAPFYRGIHRRLPGAWGPAGREIDVELVFGGWDPLAKDAVLDQWAEALPQAEGHMTVLDGVSHFVEEERPERVARAVVDAGGL
jgi:pimeloyl-ACP methyl ester carboxylesterase